MENEKFDPYGAQAKNLEHKTRDITKQTKDRITKIVKDYITMFPEEYLLVCDQIKMRRDNNKDEFASTKEDGYIERELFNVPQTLYNMFANQLTEQELLSFKGLRASRWFAKKFKQFAAPEQL